MSPTEIAGSSHYRGVRLLSVLASIGLLETSQTTTCIQWLNIHDVNVKRINVRCKCHRDETYIRIRATVKQKKVSPRILVIPHSYDFHTDKI